MDLDRLQAYLDGTLSPEEEKALQLRLKAEPELAEALVLLAWEEASLRHWARTVRPAEDRPRSAPAARPLPRRRNLRKAVLTIAAALLVGVGIWLGKFFLVETPESPVSAVARLEQVEGEVFVVSAAGKHAGRAQQDIFPDQELQTGSEDSYALLSFAGDTRLEISANTTIRFPDPPEQSPEKSQRLFLAEGLLTANVDRRLGKRLIIASPYAEVVVLGTRFTFGSTQDAARVELETGKVEFRRQKDGKTIEVEAGRYAVAAANNDPFVSHPLPPRLLEPRTQLKDSHRSPVACVAFSPDGKLLAGGGRLLQIWDLASQQPRFTLRAHAQEIQSAAFSPDGRVLATGSADKTIKLWDPASGEELAHLAGHGGRVNAVAFSPDGKMLASGAGRWNETGEIFLWDAASGARLGALPGHRQGVMALAFSPDGQYLASGSADNTIKIWHMANWQPQGAEQPEAIVLKGHRDGIDAVAFSRSGQWLASGGRFYDRTVKVWEVGSWKERITFTAHLHAVHGVAFSPDDRWLASSSADRTVILWDLAAEKEAATLQAHLNPVTGLAFSPDGTLATAGSWDRSIKLWDLPAVDKTRR